MRSPFSVFSFAISWTHISKRRHVMCKFFYQKLTGFFSFPIRFLAIIITAAMTDATTLRLLSLLESLVHTKVLLIDIVATSFNAENRFYKYLTRINPESHLMSNLLLLTILSDNYRYFLNVAFDNNGIEMVQNFRQQKLWQTEDKSKRNHHNWPIHLDKSVTEVLQLRESLNGVTKSSVVAITDDEIKLQFQQWSKECPFLDASPINVSFMCTNTTYLKGICNNLHVLESLNNICQNHTINKQLYLIENLRQFIDFFNFYDFLIANILNSTPSPSTPDKFLKHVPKYDFIVLDVVRGLTSDNNKSGSGNANRNGNGNKTSDISFTNDASNHNIFEYFDEKQQQHHHHHHQYQQHKIKTNTINSFENSSSLSSPSLPTMPASSSAAVAATTTGTTAINSTTLAFKWRPLLILEQQEINLKTYITHSILPGYDDWLLVSTAQLWHCGSICWTIIAICVGVLIVIVVASVAAGIAMRYVCMCVCACLPFFKKKNLRIKAIKYA